MLYFNVHGDNHMFKMPFVYLEKVVESFFNSNAKFEEEFCRPRNIAVYYTLDSKFRINSIQLISFSFTDLPFMVDIDIAYGTDGYINFSTIDDYCDVDDCKWRCNFYRAWMVDNTVALRLLETKIFTLTEFENDYFEDMPYYQYEELPMRPEDIEYALSKDLPW